VAPRAGADRARVRLAAMQEHRHADDGDVGKTDRGEDVAHHGRSKTPENRRWIIKLPSEFSGFYVNPTRAKGIIPYASSGFPILFMSLRAAKSAEISLQYVRFSRRICRK